MNKMRSEIESLPVTSLDQAIGKIITVPGAVLPNNLPMYFKVVKATFPVNYAAIILEDDKSNQYVVSVSDFEWAVQNAKTEEHANALLYSFKTSSLR